MSFCDVQFSPPARHDGCCGSLRETAKPVWLAAASHLGSAVCLPLAAWPNTYQLPIVRTTTQPCSCFPAVTLVHLSSCIWCCLQGHSGSPISQCWTLTTDNSKAVQSEPEDNLKHDTCQILQGKVCQNWEYYILNVTELFCRHWWKWSGGCRTKDVYFQVCR